MNILKRGLVIELMENFQTDPWLSEFPKGTIISVNNYNISYSTMTTEKFPEGIEQISGYKEKHTFSGYTREIEEAIKEIVRVSKRKKSAPYVIVMTATVNEVSYLLADWNVPV